MQKKKSSMVKNSVSISIIVCMGKVLGFIKQAVIAAAFGATGSTDIFFAADSYIAMFGQIMSQSVSPTVLTHYVRVRKTGGDKKACQLIGDSYVVFLLIGLILVIINIIFSSDICNVIGLSYTLDQKAEMRKFLICLSPIIVCTALIGVAGGYLDFNNNFIPNKISGFFFSISLIIFVWLFHDKKGNWSLVGGFLVGYILYTIYIIITATHKSQISIHSVPFCDPEIRLMLKKFLPLAVGNSIVDLSGQVDKIIASSLKEGSVSVLYYGQVIGYDLVNSVIITSVGTVLLTSFSKIVADSDKSGGKEKIVESIQIIMCSMLFLICLIIALYLVEGNDLVKLFFERGNFNSQNTNLVSAVAICYSLGFIFMAVREIFVKAHYAFQDTFKPMITSFIGVIVNIGSSILLSQVLGVCGIALGTSISITVVAVLSMITLKKHIEKTLFEKDIIINILKIGVSFVVALISGYFFSLKCRNINYIVKLFAVSLCMILIYIWSNLFLKEKTIIKVREKICAPNRKGGFSD